VLDIVVFGAPGAILLDGKLSLSAAGHERAELAARYWLSFPLEFRPERVICVAGRPGFRSGMPEPLSGESESASMTAIMLRLGVPTDIIRPNERFPLGRDFSISTIDEAAILVKSKLISPERYSRDERLALVLHKRHGARVIDILRKFGFKKSHILLLSPERRDSKSEVVLRLAYRILVLGSWRRTTPEALQCRERRLMNICRRLKVSD
jgi:hypothetical protein